jgi:hypothetical protein
MPLRTAGRFNADLAHYAILVQHEGVRTFAERDLADACDRATTIRDIVTGQVEGVVRVYAFNPVEHTADDVTEEIAIAIARSRREATMPPPLPAPPDPTARDASAGTCVMNMPPHAPKPATHRRLLIGDMARTLVEDDIDLGDERQAIAHLDATHRAADVAALLAEALESARSLKAVLARPEGSF